MIRGARNATIVPHGKHLSIEPESINFENIEANMKSGTQNHSETIWSFFFGWGQDGVVWKTLKCWVSYCVMCLSDLFCAFWILMVCLMISIWNTGLSLFAQPRYIQTLVVRNLSTYLKRIRFQVPKSEEFRIVTETLGRVPVGLYDPGGEGCSLRYIIMASCLTGSSH